VSYSRWISSDFYTYWCSSPIPVDREDELFALHATLEETHLFTYAECKQILTDGSKLTERVTDTALTYEQVKEIYGYMEEFICDVDLHYDRKAQSFQAVYD
tara:strand:+ start:5656 stop:5958 length:303 start_codon:yes stop_codon:yes gene_type:complete